MILKDEETKEIENQTTCWLKPFYSEFHFEPQHP